MRTATRAEICILIWLAFVFGISVPSRAQDKHDVEDVLKLFPTYHVLTLEERDPETRVFLTQHFPKQNCSVVRADFDGDGTPDYALLLKADKSPTTKLVIVLCPANSACKTPYQLDLSIDSSLVYIRRVPPGSHISQADALDSDQTARVTLKAAAVELNYFEKSSVVLYWDANHRKIAEIWTSD
jgi:hypothetical protein